MSGLRPQHVLPLLILLATSSACGSDGDVDEAVDPAGSTTSSPALEAITPQGVAAVVRDALGADRIVSYSAAGESDSVGVMVELEGRQRLVVNVQIEGEVPIDSCEDLSETAMGVADCVTDEDGTITASGSAEAFSDDNTRGSTVLAQSVNPETERVVYALYETYSPRAGLDAAGLAAIVSDPALAAMTEPATNEAGSDIEFTDAN